LLTTSNVESLAMSPLPWWGGFGCRGQPTRHGFQNQGEAPVK
jgi:hypothetical protein